MDHSDDMREQDMAEAPEALLPLGDVLEHSLNFRIRMAQILSFRHFEKKHPGHGGAARSLGLLSIIEANPGEQQHRLARAVGLQRSSVVPILDKMEDEGIVERRNVEGDRRAKAVFLTKKGQTVVRDLSASALEMERCLIAGLDDAHVTAVIAGLDRIIDNLRRLDQTS